MAEIVENRLSNAIDQLNIVVEFGILTKDEAKDILSKREKFEYAIHKRSKCKLDFLKYIRFEIGILEALDNYRKNVMKDYHQRKKMIRPMDQDKESPEAIQNEIILLKAKKLSDITHAMASNISYLFRKLGYKYKFDTNIWQAYIEFALSRRWNTRVSALYWRLLRLSPNDPKIWIKAANHEIYVNKAYDAARSLYLRGIRHHRQCADLWADYFKMELRFMDLVDRRANVIFKTTTNTDDSKEQASEAAVWDEDPLKADTDDMDIDDDENNDENSGIDNESIATNNQGHKSSRDIKINAPVPENNDGVLCGKLSQIVYEQARSTLRDEFREFLANILAIMLKMNRESSGLTKLKDYIINDIRELSGPKNDYSVSSEFAENCENLEYLENYISKMNSDNKTIDDKNFKATTKSKLSLLQECNETKGIEEARALYEELNSKLNNQKLSLYVGMIQIEDKHSATDKSQSRRDRVRRIYEAATIKYGKKNAKLWFNYLKFEQSYAKTLEDFDRVNDIYEKAQRKLNAAQADRLIELYTMMKDNPATDASDYSDLDD